MEPFIPLFPQHKVISSIVLNLTRYLRFNAYIEPNVGTFSCLYSLSPKEAYLSDTNDEVLNALQVIKFNPTMLIAVFEAYSNLDTANYLEKLMFIDPIKRAARFTYLYSMQKGGESFTLTEELKEKVYEYSVYLNSNPVEIVNEAPRSVIHLAGKRDLVYLNTEDLDMMYLNYLNECKAHILWIYNNKNEELENFLPKSKLITDEQNNFRILFNFR